MHEASLVAGVLRMAEEEARKHGAARITGVRLEVGLLACVEVQTLRGCFEIFAEGGMAEGAWLDVRTAPLDCRCDDCGHAFRLETRHFICPACGGAHISFKGGHGCRLTAVNVESQEKNHG